MFLRALRWKLLLCRCEETSTDCAPDVGRGMATMENVERGALKFDTILD